jgi:hypothetical protein
MPVRSLKVLAKWLWSAKPDSAAISNKGAPDSASLSVVAHLLQAPESLAYLLEAAGAVALERCGAILDERLAGSGSATGE